jgi:UTP-glucose-1-phosphate uridylyltransferase
MLRSFSDLGRAPIIAVAPVTLAKMRNCGVASLARKPEIPGVFPVRRMVEKPDPRDPICRSKRAFGIVGRYVLTADVIGALHKLKVHKPIKLELTSAIEALRDSNHAIYGYQLETERQDVGEVIEQAGTWF